MQTAALTFLMIAAVGGCRQDEITRYQVPKAPQPPPARASSDETPGPRARMLAAIVPHAEQTWFFKFLGPESIVTAQKPAFEAFLRSVRFHAEPDRPVTWTVPQGWQEEGASGSRLATLRVAAAGQFAELTVTPLGREASNVLANVGRWRGQLGLPPISEAELADYVTEMKTAAGTMTVVDLLGSAPEIGPSAAQRLPGPRGRPVADLPPADVEYKLPAGWTRGPKPNKMTVAALQIVGKEGQADVTIVPLPAPVTQDQEVVLDWLMANFNRWRGQVGLEPISAKKLLQDAGRLDVTGRPATYVKFYGPEAAGAKRRGLLGVVVPLGGYGWFITMKGPAGLVAAQEGSFEEFVRSVRFNSTPAPKAP